MLGRAVWALAGIVGASGRPRGRAIGWAGVIKSGGMRIDRE